MGRQTGLNKADKLQKLDGDVCTGFCIGQCVVVVAKIIATGGRYGLELMIGQHTPKASARSGKRIVKLIIRIIHPIDPMNGL